MDELLSTLTDTESIHESARAWITTEVHPKFPISLLQVCANGVWGAVQVSMVMLNVEGLSTVILTHAHCCAMSVLSTVAMCACACDLARPLLCLQTHAHTVVLKQTDSMYV